FDGKIRLERTLTFRWTHEAMVVQVRVDMLNESDQKRAFFTWFLVETLPQHATIPTGEKALQGLLAAVEGRILVEVEGGEVTEGHRPQPLTHLVTRPQIQREAMIERRHFNARPCRF